MSATVAQITEELKALIHDTVKEAVLETLRDPDAGLELRSKFESRLQESLTYVEEGGELIPVEEMVRRLESK